MYTSVIDVFKYPCNSTKIGIMKLGGLCKNKKVVLIDDIKKKCVLFENRNQSYAVTLLHNSLYYYYYTLFIAI